MAVQAYSVPSMSMLKVTDDVKVYMKHIIPS